MRLTASTVPLFLLLAACAEPAPDAPVAEENPADASTTPAVAETPATAVADTIPAALHGRWGLVRGDCTSSRGDAKGLMEVTADGVTFYESRGTVARAGTAGEDSFRAVFAMTGEGMEWTRDMALTLADDGTTLVRSEYGEDALAEPLTYTKCA